MQARMYIARSFRIPESIHPSIHPSIQTRNDEKERKRKEKRWGRKRGGRMLGIYENKTGKLKAIHVGIAGCSSRREV